MTRSDRLNEWLKTPLVKSVGWALVWASIAVVVPAAVRAALGNYVGTASTIFFVPGVLLAAIFLGWRYAVIVALASSLVVDWFFVGGTRLLFEGPADFVVAGAFLFASALIIASVELPRRVRKDTRHLAARDEDPAGIIFSLEDGQAWASWYGQGSNVKLGPEGEVEEMMQDFLAQLEVGRRLTKR